MGDRAGTYIIAFQLKGFKLQGDAVLRGSHHLPDTILVCGVLLRPPGAGDGAVQLGEESATGHCTEENRLQIHLCWGPSDCDFP